MSRQLALPANTTRTDPWVFRGGLNTEGASIEMQPGQCIDAMNYEPAVGQGYTRVMGYERFDGRPSPSAQSYWLLPLSITGVVVAGNAVNGQTSGATAVVLQVNAAELVLSKVVGTFQNAENIRVSTTVIGVASGTAVISAATDQLSHATYTNLAADLYRADILVVPGSGPVRGVWRYKGVTYAFRNNAGGSACVMHKSTSSGWSAIVFGEELAFTAGTAVFTEGGTVTQGGVSATVNRVVLQSGSWGGGTAAGRLIISGRTGGNFGAGAIAGSGGAAATGSGIQTTISLDPGGRFEFRNKDFAAGERMYGCDGKNRAFEFDGTTFAPISTGMSPDTPTHIEIHKEHLFLSFGPSVQHSGIATPYQWTVVSGAAEIRASYDVTAIYSIGGEAKEDGGGALIFTTTRTIHVLYGNSSADWNRVRVTDSQGAYPYTVQDIMGVRYLSMLGVVSLSASASYGNFQFATATRAVQRLIAAKGGNAVASAILRARNQYRIYWADGTGMIMGFDAKSVSIMPFLLSDPIFCACSELEQDGKSERIFYGANTSGYVYEAERGTSNDGAPIESWLRLPFWHSKSPSIRKHWRRAEITAKSAGYSSLNCSYEIDYSSDEVPVSGSVTAQTFAKGGYWDDPTLVWDEFFWDGKSSAVFEMDAPGDGTTVSLLFYGSSDIESPHTIESAVLHFSPRRLSRSVT